MLLLRVALMILAVLSSTLVPAAAVAHCQHGERQATATAGLHAGQVLRNGDVLRIGDVHKRRADLGHARAGRADVASSGMPCSHHHDAGKCCGLPCCCSTFFACTTTASLAVPLPLVRARTLVVDDRPREGVATGLPQEPPIAG